MAGRNVGCTTGPYAVTYGNVLRSLDAHQVTRVIALFVTWRTSAKWSGEEVSCLLT